MMKTETKVEKLIIKRNMDGTYELYADEKLLLRADDAESIESVLDVIYQNGQFVPYTKQPQ